MSVPGTVGGAVVNNAGAHGSDMAASLSDAVVLDAERGPQLMRLADLDYGYRYSSLKARADRRFLVLMATFSLQRGDPAQIQARMDECIAYRKQTQPPGASLGLSTFLGQNINFLPVNEPINNPQAQRWSFGVQRELPGNWLVDLAYVGNAGYDGVVNTNIFNTIPRQFLSTSLFRDPSMVSTNSFLTSTVDSPFRNLVPGASINNPTVQRQQLLRPFPHFGTITGIRNDASSRFHSGQLRVEKRFSRGYSLLAAYNWSKFLEEGSFLNESDTEFERRFSDADIPHRLVVSGIWELPFGRGRKFGANWNPALNVIAGGWQAQGIWNWQSGRTNLSIGNVFFNGDITKLNPHFSLV